MKKILSVILAILMIVTSVPFAFAAGIYEITHQPTADEMYVETNNMQFAEYQWYEVKNSKVIDDTVATPFDGDAYGVNDAYYDADSGVWYPSYYWAGETCEMHLFSIPLKKGEAVSIEYTADMNFSFCSDSAGEIVMNYMGRKSIFTAEKDDVYSFVATGYNPVQATARLVTQTAVEGETSARLNNYELGKNYVCCVTFFGVTRLLSDEVYAHEHTVAELTCGHFCTICGACYGEGTGDHSFTRYRVTTLPTSTKEGVKKAVCDYGCGTVDEQSIPAGSTAIDVVYDENGDRLGFKTITVNDKVYFDIFDGQKNLDGMSVADFYKAVLTKKHNNVSALDVWSRVAENVFRIGGQEFGYNYEFDSYDDWYSKNDPDVEGNNKANADIDLQYQFSQTAPYSAGNPEDYCVRASGLELHSSLNNVQNTMLEQITEVCGETSVASSFKQDVLEFCTVDGEGLELLKSTDSQPVLAQVITNQYDDESFIGMSTERWFSSFGIAFYDFKMTPVVEENLQYISAADNYETVKDAFDNDVSGVSYKEGSDGTTSISYIQNPTNTSTSVSASSSKSVTNSVSNSFSESESYSFTESISTNLEWTPIKDFFKFSVNIGFSASQALSTAYSEDKSLSETVSTSSSASVTLPPYTEIGIKQSTSTVEQSFEYSCPVYVTYKVAIFGINAQYLHDFGTGSWNVVDYDQGSICVGFGCKDSLGGISAVENLYNRVNADSTAFEVSYGNVSGMYKDQEDGHDPKLITCLDWNSPEVKYPDKVDYDLKDLAAKAKNNIPMSSMGGKMLINTESINTDLTPIYPLYDLKRIRFEDSGAYTLGIGGKLDLNTVNTIGLNQFDREYYGFLPRMGTWYICDEDGNDITFEEGKGISLEPTPSTQTIIAHELGEYYVRFDIDEQYYTKAVDRKTYITNDDLEFTAILKLSVTDTGNNHTCRPGGWITYIPANCVVEGERYRNCLTCSKRMATEVIPKTDHVPVEVVTPATCNTDGSKTTTCLTCKAIISNEVIPAKGHGSTYSVTTVTPTCTRDGEKALYCYDCNKLVGSETIASPGHDNGVWKVDFEATPEHEGQMTKYCSTCNYALESKTFAYHTHSYTSFRSNKDGTHSRSCSKCGYTETNDCDYNETVVPATCTVDGKTTYQCKDCKHKYSETSSYAQGHSWGEWIDTDSENHSSTCTVCGASETTVHIFVEYIPNNDATKDADGTKTATCVVCDAKDTVVDEGSRLPEEPTDKECSHICHNTGVFSFFWKIIRVFWKLFRMNPVCECGAAHY